MDRATQFLLPPLAIAGNALISMKQPQAGLLVCLLSEIFWFYSGLLAWKQSGQIGMFITNIAIGATVLYGVVNYWFLS
jgi:hypothetical protein